MGTTCYAWFFLEMSAVAVTLGGLLLLWFLVDQIIRRARLARVQKRGRCIRQSDVVPLLDADVVLVIIDLGWGKEVWLTKGNEYAIDLEHKEVLDAKFIWPRPSLRRVRAWCQKCKCSSVSPCVFF